MKLEILEYVAKCPECQRWTKAKHGFHPMRPINALLPMDHVAVDLAEFQTSADGFNYALIFVDVATKFVII
jgi:hypothetical protein